MFEIVEGDFGSPYKIVVKGLDLSLCSATISVWNPDDDVYLFQDKSCGSITYDVGDAESYCYFTPADGDFPEGSAIDNKQKTYKAMVEFTKTGYKEHDMGFEWIVVPAPPT